MAIEPLSASPLLPDARLRRATQQQQVDTAMLSTLEGPSDSFFSAATPPAASGRMEAFAAPGTGPGAYSPIGARETLNVPLLETMQEGRVTSALFSSVMAPAARFFSPPAPPVTVEPLQNPPAAQTPRPGAAANAGAGAPVGAAAQTTRGVIPPIEEPLLEAEQAGQVTSALLSGVLGTGRPGDEWAWQMAPQTSPGALVGPQFAAQAYRTEMNAPQGPDSPGTSVANRREWFG